MKRRTTGKEPGGADWSNMLRARLLRNSAAHVSAGPQSGHWTVAVPTRKPAWLIPPLSWVIRPPVARTLLLDALGSEVWNLCDGKHTVEEIIESFARSNDLTFHESRVSVTAYCKSLLRHGALVLVQ